VNRAVPPHGKHIVHYGQKCSSNIITSIALTVFCWRNSTEKWLQNQCPGYRLSSKAKQKKSK